MERLRGTLLQSGIHRTLTLWHEAILKVQEKRREEVINALSNRNNASSSHLTNDRGKFANLEKN